MLSWGCREALSCGGHEGAGIWLRRGRRAASSSLRTASAQPAGSLVLVSESRSAVLEGRGLESGEAPHESEEGANGRQSRILDSQSSGITCQSKILDSQSSGITSEVIPLDWQSSGDDWQCSGLDSESSAVDWQSKSLDWQSSGITCESCGVTSESSGMLWESIWGVREMEDGGSGSKGAGWESGARSWRAGRAVWLSMLEDEESGREHGGRTGFQHESARRRRLLLGFA